MNKCKTKYPIVLVHGTGFRDLKYPLYWGRIPDALSRNGAKIYYGLQDSWGSIESNAQYLAKRIIEITKEYNCEKVNIIAHSKGGLDARMAAFFPEVDGKIASLTTVSTPHHGSKTADWLIKAPEFCFNIAAFIVNNWIKVVGDENPDFKKVCRNFSTENMRLFNEKYPDLPNIFYQSYASKMKNIFSDGFMSLSYAIVKHFDGENDGLVSTESAIGTKNHTILEPYGRRGISHWDMIDFRRKTLSKCKKDGCVYDICDVYIKIAEELKNKGF